jgi:hypothetical protein
MTARIWRAFHKLERQKDGLLHDLSTWPTSCLAYKPNAGAWTAYNVLDHVIRVEESVIEDIQANVATRRTVTMRDHLGALLVNCVMRSPMRIAVPDSATMVLPTGISDLAELKVQWAKTRWNMSALLHSLSADELHCGLFRHPVAGWMTMPETMTFCSAHLAHHVFQLNRLRRASANL